MRNMNVMLNTKGPITARDASIDVCGKVKDLYSLDMSFGDKSLLGTMQSQLLKYMITRNRIQRVPHYKYSQ